MRTDLNLRIREGMPTLLLDETTIIAAIKDARYENLIVEAGRLREQLDFATLILDNLPGVSVDTRQMHQVLANSRLEGV